MTPAEIRLKYKLVTQDGVDLLARELDNWMVEQRQPSKDLKRMVMEMKADHTPPAQQAEIIFNTLSDWFAYGN